VALRPDPFFKAPATLVALAALGAGLVPLTKKKQTKKN
jgi:hypothetical protein